MNRTIRELQEENNILLRKLQKLSESKRLLKQSRDKYKLLIEANIDMIWETDQDGRLIYLSPQLKKLWNIDPADALGKMPHDFVFPDEKEMKAAELSSIRSSRLPFNDVLFNALDGNGKLVYLEVTGSPVFDDARVFMGYRGIARDITRRTVAEAALKESNIIATQRLNEIEYLYLNLPIGLCVMDLDLRFLRINEKLAEINGLPVSAHLGKTVAEVLPSLHESAQSILKKILETGEPQMGIEVSGTTVAQPGVVRTWSEDWLPIRDINGKIVSVNVMVVETTKQKKADEEKRKSEERFKIMGEILPYGIWLCDSEGKVVYTSDSFLELLNMTMDESKGFGWAHRLVPEDVNPMMQKWFYCIKTGKDWDHIHRIIDRYGNIKSVLTRGRPMHDNDGKIISWAGINLDITERVEAEEELKHSKEALEKSQEKLQIALDNGNIGIWEWDLVTGEVKWDERMERMFGLEPGTFGGTREYFESLVHEEDLQHLDASIIKGIRSGKYFDSIFRTKPQEGKSNFISSKALIERDNDGNAVAFSGVCFDVTDMKEGAEKSLIELNEALLRSNSDLQQFAYVASHDLQEPLRMVTSFTQLLQMQYSEKLDQRANEYIHFAVDGSKRMYELLNGLLAYSRVNTRGKPFEVISMETVIQKVQENLRLVITEKGANITVEAMPMVKADESQMIQLIQNLIDNSIKFCKLKPIIVISSSLEKGKYVFSVVDNGLGIDPQYHDRIFRIFQRLHLRDEYIGTGIGLAISRKIVERHGGEIWVDSDQGKGSTFKFTIPVTPVH